MKYLIPFALVAALAAGQAFAAAAPAVPATPAAPAAEAPAAPAAAVKASAEHPGKARKAHKRGHLRQKRHGKQQQEGAAPGSEATPAPGANE